MKRTEVVMTKDIHINIETLSNWLIDMAHTMQLSSKEFNSVLVIARARFDQQIPRLLSEPVKRKIARKIKSIAELAR